MKKIPLLLILASLALGGENGPIEKIGEPLLLAESKAGYMAPKWSPAGTNIIFSGRNYLGIYLFSMSNSSVKQLSNKPAAGFGMCWSNSGKKIATRLAEFSKKRRRNSIVVYDINDLSQTVVLEHAGRLSGVLQWTADDKSIYLNGCDRFNLLNLNPGMQKPSINDIIYLQNGKLYQNSQQGQRDLLIDIGSDKIILVEESPDRSKIAYKILGGNLYIINSDGSNTVDLGYGMNPTWSPDSKRLAFMIDQDDGHRIVSSDIFVVNADGSDLINLTVSDDIIEMHPDWSPDGRWIAYDTHDSGQIWMQEVH